MVLSASSAAAARLRRRIQEGACAAVALVAVACNAYDPSLLDGHRGRGGATTGAGGSPVNSAQGGSAASSGAPVAGTGGAASSGAAPGSSGGTRSGDGGASGGTTGGAASSGGQVAGNRGGSGPNDTTGGTLGLGGAVGAAGTSSGGNVAIGTGGAPGGGNEAGGAGKGGATTGSAGSAGTNGGGGATSSGGTANGGSAGTAGAGEVCSGCARLSVPLTMTSDRARFTLSLPSKTDLTDATITLRASRQRGTGGTLLAYVQEGSPNYAMLFSAPIAINSLGTAMQSIIWNIGDAAGSADTTAIERIGIEIVGTGGSSFTNPTVIYVDRVDVVGSSLGTGSWPLDTSASVHTTPTSSGPVGKMWLNSYSADTNVSSAAISWLGP